MSRSVVILCTVLAACLAGSAVAEGNGGDHDEDRARAAREAGSILPLADILARAQRDFGGRLLDVELERRDEDNGAAGRSDDWIYELKLLAPDGAVVKLAYDARTGRLIQVERPAHAGHGAGRENRRGEGD
jgi:uncharacterized membrane protein YkoI